MQRNAMVPASGETVEVTIPRHRVLKVVIRTAEKYGDLPAPFSAETLGNAPIVANDEKTTAKTVRPARRGVA